MTYDAPTNIAKLKINPKPYPRSIRFWYLVHDKAERIWHWVWKTKLSPWHEADRATRQQVPPSYHMIGTIEATDTPEPVEIQPGVFVTLPTKSRDVTAHKIYVRRD